MRATALALITASILSLAACGGDDSTTSGPGTGGSGGSGGASGTGGSGGKAGSGGSSGGGAGGSSGSGGSSGGGQAGTTPGDAATPMDVRRDTTTGGDAPADRPTTPEAGSDSGTPDAMPPSDGSSMDTSSPPESGQPDTTPPSDGSSGDASSDAPAGDGSATMVLTSSAYTEGMTIPAAHTCAGTNVSPPLSWTAGPAGTLSYAIVFTDKSNGLVHSGIYDIPANVTSLPMAVEKVSMPSNPAGSKQVMAYNNMPGYAGPCPGAMVHTYEFMLYAVDIAALPGVMTTQKGAALVTALQAHDLATTTLTGKASTSATAR